MGHQRPFLKAAWLGIATIIFSIVLQSVSPNTISPLVEKAFTSPVLAFEFAETEAEVEAIFNFDTEEEKETFKTKMRRGTNLDFIFMLLYNGFLFLLGWVIYRLSGEKVFLFILPLAVLAFAGDLMENLQLLKLITCVETGEYGDSILLLRWFTWLKWGALAAIMPILGLWLLRGNLWSKLLAVIACLLPVWAIYAFFNPGLISEIFSLGIAIMFVGLTIYSFLYKNKGAAQDI